MKREFVIDPEFQRITVPHTKAEREAFEKSILSEGCLEPISVWNNIIVDGHKRYEFCSFEEIDFEVRELYFQSRDEVLAWICRKRLNSIPPDTAVHRYLTGKWYRCIRPKYNEMVKSGVIEPLYDGTGRIRTSKVMAKDIGVGYSSIENGEAYSRCYDKLAVLEPDIFEAIMSGKIKVGLRDLRLIVQRNQKAKSKIRSRLYPDREARVKERPPKKVEVESGVMLSTGIKNMPAFDPDMEINGLALTIPTWMASIARAERKTDMTLASEHAKKQLTNSLLRLEAQIRETLEALECTEKEF